MFSNTHILNNLHRIAFIIVCFSLGLYLLNNLLFK